MLFFLTRLKRFTQAEFRKATIKRPLDQYNSTSVLAQMQFADWLRSSLFSRRSERFLTNLRPIFWRLRRVCKEDLIWSKF